MRLSSTPQFNYLGIIVIICLLLAVTLGIWLIGNREIFIWSNNFAHHKLAEYIWLNITLFGNHYVCLSIAMIIAAWRPSLVPSLILSIITTGLVVSIIKNNLDMLRPALTFSTDEVKSLGINIFGNITQSNTFPSGHTTIAWVLALNLYVHTRSYWLKNILLSGAIIVGLSRLMVGAHWPLDVSCGALLACIITILVMHNIHRLPHAVMQSMHYLFIALAIAATFNLLLFGTQFINSQALLFSQAIAVVALLSSYKYITSFIRSYKQ